MSSTTIEVACPQCQRRFQFARDRISARAHCPCGAAFVVAERHTRDCPHCGQENRDRDPRCVRCGRNLTVPPLPHQTRPERSDVIDPADHETDQVRQDLDHRLRHRRRARRLRRVLLLCSIPLVLWAGWSWLRYRAAGQLPSVEDVQRDMKLWPLEPRAAILRGRPLTQVPFTDDASRPARAPILSLWLDDQERVVAFSCWIITYHPRDDNQLYHQAQELAKLLKDREPNADTSHRAWFLGTFARRYLDLRAINPALAADDAWSADDPYDGDPNAVCGTVWWSVDRYDCEQVILSKMDQPDPEQRDFLQRNVLHIIKSRDW